MVVIAKTLQGLENVLTKELIGLGAEEVVPLKRAVKFQGDLALLYKVNLESKLAIKFIVPIESTEITNEQELYTAVGNVEWTEIIGNDRTFAIDAASSSKLFTHTQYIALKSKDAIVDQHRAITGDRPNIDTENPDIRINIHIRDTTLTISLDSTGRPLNQRGYRKTNVEAPINEVLAAGMIALTNWTYDCDFYNPMCGSGTLAIEAIIAAKDLAPNAERNDFCFKEWADFDNQIFSNTKENAVNKKRDFKYKVFATDLDDRAISATTDNIEAFGFENMIEVSKMDFFKSTPKSKGLMILNPPYDGRLHLEDTIEFYQEIGDLLKKQYEDFDVWIISGHMKAIKRLGLRATNKNTLFNGPIECKYQMYAMYRGSKKSKYNKKHDSE